MRGTEAKLAFAVALLILGQPALAYMGPGAGLSAVGSLFALIAAVAAGLFGFVWFPIKRLLKGRQKPALDETATTEPGAPSSR